MIFAMKDTLVAVAMSMVAILGANASPPVAPGLGANTSPAGPLPGSLEARAAMSGCDQGYCPDGMFSSEGFDVTCWQGFFTYRYRDYYGDCYVQHALKFGDVTFDDVDGANDIYWSNDPNYVFVENRKTGQQFKYERHYMKIACGGGDIEIWWPGKQVA